VSPELVKVDAKLPDLCALCGTNPPDPALTSTVSGTYSAVTLAWRRRYVTSFMAYYYMEVCLCSSCYTKLQQDRRDATPVVFVRQFLIGLTILGLTLFLVSGLNLLMGGLFVVCLIMAVGLYRAEKRLFVTEIGGFLPGGWWFDNPTYEREFAELNPDLLLPTRWPPLAQIERMRTQNKKE